MRMCWTCSPTGQTSSFARSHSCFLRSSVGILRNISGTVRLSLRPVVSWPPDAPCLQVTASVQINTELYSSFYRLHCWPLCFIFEISMISCLFKLVASVLSDYEWHGAWWMFLSLELYILYSTHPQECFAVRGRRTSSEPRFRTHDKNATPARMTDPVQKTKSEQI